MSNQCSSQAYWHGRQVIFLTASAVFFLVMLIVTPRHISGQAGMISEPIYQLLSERVTASRTRFNVYLDQDSPFNHGFPSGFFASNPTNLGTIHIDTGCVFDQAAPNNCSTDSHALDRTRGTVMRISFDRQTPGNFAGVNIEEPENWGALHSGTGYDLRGTNAVTVDARSPDGAMVQFSIGGCTTLFTPLPVAWSTLTIPLNSLGCTPDLSDVHLLFGVAIDDTHGSSGATVLLDDLTFTPFPTSRLSIPAFPLGNQTFGVVPRAEVPIPSDQVLRNLTTIYESALTELVLLARGGAQDLANARQVADAFDYALHHESHGDPLPVAPDGSVGLHNAYEGGDLSLFNDQRPPKQGRAGDVRLAGFTATTLCPTTGFCLVLDGATGGNDAFAVLALVGAFQRFGDTRYLNDALTIGHWIVGNLTDTSGAGYGGYFLGYPDVGVPPPKPLQTGKSIENNADVFAALTALAAVESQLGNSMAAATWTAAANVAGDFVMQMFDAAAGRFNVGTVPTGTVPAPGICPNGLQQGNDVINTCDFLDSDTFPTLAMAGAARYRHQIDWRRPVQYVLDHHFAQTIGAGGHTFQGFDIVPTPTSGPNGVAWEFTAQAIEAMRYVDQLYGDTRFESSATLYLTQLAQAQAWAPFADGRGLVASTLQDGDTLPPLEQCLQTPFQCIAERVGLAASTWAIVAEQQLNVFTPTVPAITVVTPSGARRGQTNVVVRVIGQFTHFVQGVTVANFGAGITVNTTVLSPTQATATVTIPAGAVVGPRTVTVTTGGEVVALPGAFVVAPVMLTAGDFEGDSKSDITVYRPSTGVWHTVLSSTGTPTSFAWGNSADNPVVGDFDGDRKTDIAVFRPSTGTWYVVPSTTGVAYGFAWGNSADTPTPGDYDGDGKTDITVYRPSNGTWYVVPSSTGVPYGFAWGNSADVPVPGDYDGDGKTDIAVFRPSSGTWYVVPSTTGVPYGLAWGNSADRPVAADYDGDGRTDIAVFRPSNGTWYVVPSTTGVPYGFAWGNSADITVPGDYDGDGKTDIAVFRPSNGTWYVVPSTGGAPYGFAWGNSADIPVFRRP